MFLCHEGLALQRDEASLFSGKNKTHRVIDFTVSQAQNIFYMYPINLVKARGKIAKQYISVQRIDVPCHWLLIKIYPHVCCCVDIIISLNVYLICTDADNTAINNI